MFCAGLCSMLGIMLLSVGLVGTSLQIHLDWCILLKSQPVCEQLAGKCIHPDVAVELQPYINAESLLLFWLVCLFVCLFVTRQSFSV